MNEAEKKAIELMEICMYGTEESTIIKNLIEKQQKEIEHLKNEKEVEYISKDKIRKIKKELIEIKNTYFTDIGKAINNAEIALLETILEGNNNE